MTVRQAKSLFNTTEKNRCDEVTQVAPISRNDTIVAL